ncbi:MAG: hypothetical protein J3K34DRAFT_464755 [Monoraphidium minutum]|nr:MAG: hypothetical protein J3K34DRAFT_464755 [Monoraphidium minutum]
MQATRMVYLCSGCENMRLKGAGLYIGLHSAGKAEPAEDGSKPTLRVTHTTTVGVLCRLWLEEIAA